MLVIAHVFFHSFLALFSLFLFLSFLLLSRKLDYLLLTFVSLESSRNMSLIMLEIRAYRDFPLGGMSKMKICRLLLEIA